MVQAVEDANAPVAKAPAAVPEWQVSQAMVPTGTWIVVDSVTSAVPPLLVKLLPEAWQVAHAVVLLLAA